MLTEKDAAERLEKEKIEQAEVYSVIIDGNMHHLNKRIVTNKEQITVKKCQRIVKHVQDVFDIEINKIQIMMTQWDYNSLTPLDYLYVLYNDRDVPKIGASKDAYYFPKSNTLRIWEDGMPVYENANGIICKDEYALADCLM